LTVVRNVTVAVAPAAIGPMLAVTSVGVAAIDPVDVVAEAAT